MLDNIFSLHICQRRDENKRKKKELGEYFKKKGVFAQTIINERMTD